MLASRQFKRLWDAQSVAAVAELPEAERASLRQVPSSSLSGSFKTQQLRGQSGGPFHFSRAATYS